MRAAILTEVRQDIDGAVAEFARPDVGPAFNRGIDWFDVIARDNGREALVLVEEDSGRTVRTFAELSRHSDQPGSV
ncbi:hypothetical protein ABZ569_20750 [Streptomyces albus]|uniref:hypothetical protein n=1 Tax=Streptomyces albus TaxID=1888 RepID=UPI0033D46F7D